jgi:hypothetical protein
LVWFGCYYNRGKRKEISQGRRVGTDRGVQCKCNGGHTYGSRAAGRGAVRVDATVMKRGFYSKFSLHFSHPLTGPTDDPTGGVPFDRAGPCASHVARLALLIRRPRPCACAFLRCIFWRMGHSWDSSECFFRSTKKKKHAKFSHCQSQGSLYISANFLDTCCVPKSYRPKYEYCVLGQPSQIRPPPSVERVVTC